MSNLSDSKYVHQLLLRDNIIHMPSLAITIFCRATFKFLNKSLYLQLLLLQYPSMWASR